MSHARLSIWLNRAIADYLTPGQKETVMAEFLRQASNDAGGHRVYIPVVARADYELVMTMDALQREGKSLRQIARLFRLSHETVRAKLSKIRPIHLTARTRRCASLQRRAHSMSELYDTRPAPMIERLARIEGQSNFLSLLAGVEAGPDTTQDMGALAFARCRGAIPEVLEAHVAQSAMYRLPLMSIVWHAVRDECWPKEKDWPWIQGAIADAFLLLSKGRCKTVEQRAKRFKVDKAAYGAMRNLATGVFNDILERAEREYRKAMSSIRETPPNRHSGGTPSTFSERARIGHYIQPMLASSDAINDQHTAPIDTHGVGIADRLGWDERNAAPGPVTIKLAQPTASGKESDQQAEP